MDLPQSIPLIVVGFATVVAAAFDLRTFRIPNVLTVSLFASGLLYHALFGFRGSFVSALLGVGFGLGILFLLYMVGAMGAGDVKLMAGVGAWLGMPAVVYIFIIAALATGIYSVALLLWQRSLGRAFIAIQVLLIQLGTVGRHLNGDRVEDVVESAERRRRLVPFGAMVAIGSLAFVVWTRVR